MANFKTHTLITQRTATYCSLGELGPHTEYIWIVFHGYAQLASEFIHAFDKLDKRKHYIIAPEGLSKFYWEKYNGKVGASWMTSENRPAEISDYIQFIDKVCQQVFHSMNWNKHKLITLGFSQGVTTMSRWFFHTSYPIHYVISYAGQWAKELELSKLHSTLKQTHNIFAYGTEDKWIPEKRVDAIQKKLKRHDIALHIMPLKGKHSLESPHITQIVKKIEQLKNQ